MGCFIACFGGSKGRKGRRPTPRVLPRNTNYDCRESQLPTSFLKPATTEIQGGSILESREKPDKTDALIGRSQKKVTFDLQVKTYSEARSYEEKGFSLEKESKEATKYEIEQGNENQTLTSSEDYSTTSAACSFPASHRYQNCRHSDGEDDSVDDGDLSDDNLTDDDDGYADDDDDDYADDEHEELFEWYSSPSFESESKSVSPPSGETEADVNPRPNVAVGRVRDRSQYVHPVLNAVENRSQWQALKSKESKSAPVLNERKENIPFNHESVTKFSLDSRQEMRVDASLSNWLIPSESAKYAYSSTAPLGISEKFKDGGALISSKPQRIDQF